MRNVLRWILVVIGVLAALTVWRALFGQGAFIHQQALRADNAALRRANDTLLHEIERQEERIRELRVDSVAVEGIARTERGMSRKGELVYRFVPAQRNAEDEGAKKGAAEEAAPVRTKRR